MSRRTAPADRDAAAPLVSRVLRGALRKTVPVLTVLVPFGAWFARWRGFPRAGDALALVVVVAVTAGVARALGAAFAVRLAVTLAALVAAMAYAGLPAAFLPPVAVNVAFAFVFAATLRNGPPLIERFARRSGATITAEKARYTRALTAAWAAYLALLAAIGIGVALTHDERLGAWWAALDYALVGAFFVVEYAWRRHRTPDTGGWRAHLRNATTGWRAPRG